MKLRQRSSSARADRLSDEKRRALRERLDDARQSAEAAALLFSNDQAAEALRLAKRAFETAYRSRALEDLRPLADEIASTKLPADDADVELEHRELLARLLDGHEKLDAVLSDAALSDRQLQWSRALRIALPVTLAVGLLGALSIVGESEAEFELSASGQRTPTTGWPHAAVDGDRGTEWQTPDGRSGWLEIEFPSPRAIDTLHILNGHAGRRNDRALRFISIEIYSRGHLGRTLEHTFTRVLPRPEWLDLDVGIVDVTRIRLVVHSFHQEGAALAEIRWE